MTRLEEIDALEKDIANLNLRVGGAVIKNSLLKEIQLLRDALVNENSKQDTQLPKMAIKEANHSDVPSIEGTLVHINGKSIFIPESLKKEARQIFSRIRNETLQDELTNDYFIMHLHQQLDDVFEGARLAHLQVENIVNCALEIRDVLNNIKRLPLAERIRAYDIRQKKEVTKHPGAYTYGDDMTKWPSEINRPTESRFTFNTKLSLYFAYCSDANNNSRISQSGVRDGTIQYLLNTELRTVRYLRDAASHRFALSSSEQANDLLKCSVGEAFSKMRSTLQIFRNTMPAWL